MHRALGMARADSAKNTDISGRRMAAQRVQVLARVEQPSTAAWRWVPVAAAASLLGVGLFFNQQPHQRPALPTQAHPAVTVNAEADAELFTDVYSMERDVEPKAAAPIRALFQETSFEEERKQ
jgi:hypothetical protein